MSVIRKQASSLAEIFTCVQEICLSWNPNRLDSEEIWFRGQSQSKYQLLPGLYREGLRKYRYDEFSLLTLFRNWGASLSPPTVQTDWDWYFLAQHHGVPTRLLDWTEALLPSVYFALSDYAHSLDREVVESSKDDKGLPALIGDASPAIWVLDAGSLNKWALGHDAIYPYLDSALTGYCWDRIHKRPNGGNWAKANPVAIATPLQNPRIVAQRGVFTIHGTRARPIDEIAEKHDPKGLIKLACIQLDRNRLESMWYQMELAGTTRMSLFPELDSVAAQVKWVYQNERASVPKAPKPSHHPAVKVVQIPKSQPALTKVRAKRRKGAANRP